MPALPSHTGAKADEGTSWSAPTLADFTDSSWEELSDGEKMRIARHFAYMENSPPQSFGDLGGPHHQASSSGVGPVVWRAVSSGRMAQASWFNEAKSHLATHYRQFDKDIPWQGSHEHAKDFMGVELFRVGSWTDSKGRGRKWSDKDLRDIAQAYTETKDEVHAPIKIGHSDNQGDGEPAYGWLENIRKVGNRLVGDFMHVPDAVAKAIEEGQYRARSVELSPDFEVGEKTYKWLLTGVALLGGHLPAVSGLKDIVNLYANSNVDYDENNELILYETEDEEDEDFESELQDIFSRLNSTLKGRRGAPHIRALQTALRNAMKGAKEHSKEGEELEKAKFAQLLGLKEDASDEEFEEAINKLKTEEEEDKKEEEKEEEENDYEKRILDLEKTLAVKEAGEAVDKAIKAGKLLPKQRETAVKMALRDMKDFEEFVSTQPDKLIEFGEKGTSQQTGDYSKYEPSAGEIAVAKSMGVWNSQWRVNLIRYKASADGVEVPTDFGKEKADATNA